jgi:hypothetical protein
MEFVMSEVLIRAARHVRPRELAAHEFFFKNRTNGLMKIKIRLLRQVITGMPKWPRSLAWQPTPPALVGREPHGDPSPDVVMAQA